MSLVVDSPIALAWLFEDGRTAVADACLADTAGGASRPPAS